MSDDVINRPADHGEMWHRDGYVYIACMCKYIVSPPSCLVHFTKAQESQGSIKSCNGTNPQALCSSLVRPAPACNSGPRDHEVQSKRMHLSE